MRRSTIRLSEKEIREKMIEIKCKKNKFTYNVYHITKAFFPSEEIRQTVDEKQEPLVVLELPGGSCFSLAQEEIGADIPAGSSLSDNSSDNSLSDHPSEGSLSDGPSGSGLSEEEYAQIEKRAVTRRIYQFLSKAAGRELAWGTLTGVRPTKLIMQMVEEGRSFEEITDFLQGEYFVTRKKAELGYEIACREKQLLEKLNSAKARETEAPQAEQSEAGQAAGKQMRASMPKWDEAKGFSLYVGIPFCPSVCSYCSFSSSPIGVWRDRVDSYLDALVKEIRALGRMAEGNCPDTVYIGGGTPTTLEPEQLRRLLTEITENFDLSKTVEFTVEAGRPDSITEEKLLALKEFPVTRISINPQTMQQKTLDLVGRKHTVEDIEEAYTCARRLGFDNINMDLIAGLPEETAEDMRDTLSKIEEMQPDSLTVHSLAIKRAAKFGQEGRSMDLHTEISQMVDDAADSARKMGLKPYYLYRQKNIAGNFENVGYAKLDKAGIYNILIMEERQTILAAGAGASTKILLREPIRTEKGKEIDLVHVENVKSITDYTGRIDEMIERKHRMGVPLCREKRGV